MRYDVGRFRRPMRRSTEGQLMSLISLGDGSTLTLDFTTGVLDSRLTFTRSTTGTYIGSDGLVKTMAAAPTNDPTKARFDHDPTTLTPLGLLIEGSATNLGSYSEDFSNAAWTKSGTNGSMVLTGTAPDNNATSRLLEENTTSYAKHSLERSISISAGIHTLSVWLKESSTNSRRYAHIQLADGQATAARYTIVADLQTGTITASGASNGTAGAPTGTGHSITAYPNGWYRVTISMNHVASPSYPAIMLGDTATLFGGNNQPFYSATTPYKGLLIWGAQLEAGSGASSYIPTVASTATRNADKMSMTDITSMQWNQTAGTFFLHMDVAAETNTSSFPAFMGMYTATPIRVVRFLLNNSSGTNPRIGNDTWTAAPAQILSSLITRSTAPTAFKCAVSLSNTGQTVNQVVNAGSVTTTSGTGTLQTPTRLLWHQDPSALDTEYFPIHIRSLKYWPTALPNAQLQAITT